MSRRPAEANQVDARWRIDVGNGGPLSAFEIVVGGQTTPLTAEAARKLLSKLTTWLSVAERFAAEEAARDPSLRPASQ